MSLTGSQLPLRTGSLLPLSYAPEILTSFRDHNCVAHQERTDELTVEEPRVVMCVETGQLERLDNAGPQSPLQIPLSVRMLYAALVAKFIHLQHPHASLIPMACVASVIK
jgi:hypothetical protein